jgi:hypothetical protein
MEFKVTNQRDRSTRLCDDCQRALNYAAPVEDGPNAGG